MPSILAGDFGLREEHTLSDAVHPGGAEEAQLSEPPLERARPRARRLALTLLEQSEDPDRVEHALRTAGFQPTVCHESARWAVAKHRDALRAVEADEETLPAA